MSLIFTIGPGVGLRSPQHNCNFDEKFVVLNDINKMNHKIITKNDEDKVRLRGTTVKLEVRLRAIQFDLMEKSSNSWNNFYLCHFYSILKKLKFCCNR